MKIYLSSNDKTFNQLEEGEVFHLFDSSAIVYMKLDGNYGSEGINATAVNISSGALVFIHDATKVKKINCKLVSDE
jgi:hypothetical protein